MGGDYVTLNQLVTAFNRTDSYSYKMISWVENRGLPVHNKRVQQNTFRVVYLKEFWTWAEKNRSFLDFSKLEPLAFGEEPAWVAEQRKRDFKACSLQRKDPWTPAEDAKLRMLLEQYKYTYEQMSDMLRRSPGAIQRRCADLGLKARPVRINPHGPEAVWHQEDYDRLAEGTGIAEMQRRLDGICLTEMRVPLNRNTKNRREVELRMAADQTVTAMWCCFALAIHQTLGFGRDRLNRLHKETVENYRQFNEWNGSGSRDEQQYAFERLRHCAEQALRSEVVIVQENDDYDSRARLWERQLEDSIKASVHKAKVETKRKARVNALATNVLSDAARQQAALKVQQDFFGGGYR